MRIRWTPTAAADLQNIYDYLKEHEPHLARPTVIEIRKSARSLRKFPLRGRKGREEGTRELLQRRCRISSPTARRTMPLKFCTSGTQHRKGSPEISCVAMTRNDATSPKG